MREILGKVKKPSLPLLSVVPFDFLPEEVIGHPSIEKYVLDDYEQTDKIKVNFKIQRQLTCPATLRYFKKVLINESSKEYGDFTRIYMGGELLGVVKHQGTPIFLSLCTKRNSRGAYPLIIGGLYSLDDSVDNSPYWYNRGEWSTKSVKSLSVRPMKMLYNILKYQIRYSREILPEVCERIKQKI